jgi:hypothetical protein
MPVLQQHPSLHFREWTEAVSLQWLYATPRVLALALPRAAAGAPPPPPPPRPWLLLCLLAPAA